jgi:hypothetical protein
MYIYPHSAVLSKVEGLVNAQKFDMGRQKDKMKYMAKVQTDKAIKLKDIEKLLDNQTKVILSAVDAKLQKTDVKMNVMKVELISAMDEKIRRSEERINQKIEKLTTTLDKFLKQLTDTQNEFAAMKLDINRLKSVIKEKLGVDLA